MGVKWSFMPKTVGAKPHYLVVNADEGEPGTHKDRTLMELNPHACVEGCIIACYGMGAHVAYIYVRDELHLSKARLEGAIKEAKLKVQASIQDAQVRVTGKNKDDLQAAIAAMRQQDLGIELQFVNFRD